MNLRAPGCLGDAGSPLHRLDARVKLLAFLALLLAAVTTPSGRPLAFAGYLALLLVAAWAGRIPAGALAKRVLPLLAFAATASALIPFVHRSSMPGDVLVEFGYLHVSRAGLSLFGNVLAKASVGALGAVLLGATTPFPELLHGLQRLRVPRLLVSLTGFTYRYLFVLADEAHRMVRARDARCYGGQWLWQARVVGHMIGTLFLRAHDRAERVYVAMLARGFTGEPVHMGGTPLRRADYAFLVAAVGGAVILRAGLA